VLTGIVAGLLAQGYSDVECSKLGTYIHGLAGDLAACDQGDQALIASDIIDHLGKAFLKLTN
jgi:NAD(P)H-hydrate epimerase